MVIFMALTSMILVLVAWEVYRDSALDSQRQSLQEVLARETERVMQQVREASAELAAAIQTDADFRQALAAQDNDRLAQILGQQFQRYHVTSGVLNLVQLTAVP